MMDTLFFRFPVDIIVLHVSSALLLAGLPLPIMLSRKVRPQKVKDWPDLISDASGADLIRFQDL